MKETEFLWLPTLECPYKCSYCNARRLQTPEKEYPSDEWIKVFKELKRPINRIIISGGEPTIYPGLSDVLSEMKWNFHLNTNLAIHPSKWLTEETKKYCQSISACLQFGIDSNEAKIFLYYAEWIRDNILSNTSFSNHFIITQQIDQKIQERMLKEFSDRNLTLIFDEFDDNWLWHYWTPARNFKAQCSGGMDYFCIYVDGRVYRCTGQLWNGSKPMGNVFHQNIEEILYKNLKECDEGLCIEVPMCENIQTIPLSGDKIYLSNIPR